MLVDSVVTNQWHSRTLSAPQQRSASFLGNFFSSRQENNNAVSKQPLSASNTFAQPLSIRNGRYFSAWSGDASATTDGFATQLSSSSFARSHRTPAGRARRSPPPDFEGDSTSGLPPSAGGVRSEQVKDAVSGVWSGVASVQFETGVAQAGTWSDGLLCWLSDDDAAQRGEPRSTCKGVLNSSWDPSLSATDNIFESAERTPFAEMMHRANL